MGLARLPPFSFLFVQTDRCAHTTARRGKYLAALCSGPSFVLQFDPLQPAQLREVARLMSLELNARLKERNITMQLTDAALDFSVGLLCRAALRWAALGWAGRAVLHCFSIHWGCSPPAACALYGKQRPSSRI